MVTSDIQTDLEQDYENIPKKRHRAKPLRFESSESDEEEVPTKRRAFGSIKKPPKLEFLSTADPGCGSSPYHPNKSIETPKSFCSNSQLVSRQPNSNDERTPNSIKLIGKGEIPSATSQNSCKTNFVEGLDQGGDNFQEKDQGYKHLLAQIIKVQEQNKVIINLINSKISNNVNEKGLADDFPVRLPVDTLDNLNILEDYLQTESNHNNLVRYLSFDGGSDLRTKTNRVLRSVLTNSVACDFNFAGRKRKDYIEKRAFSQLKLCRVVIDAVNGQKHKFGVDAIETAIKLWLKHAPSRVLKVNQQVENNILP